MMPLRTIQPASNLRFIQILQAVFQSQAREILSHLTVGAIRNGKEFDLSHWLPNMATALSPLMLRDWRAGMLRTAQNIARQMRQQYPHAAPTKAWGLVADPLFLKPAVQRRFRNQIKKAATIGADFDLFNPKVLDAVNAATMQFCRETNATAIGDINDAIAKLRQELREGLQEGDALRALAVRVRNIFSDPSRAFRIAATESKRALEAGALQAAKDSGVVVAKMWLASSDACPACLLPGNMVFAPEILAATRMDYDGPVLGINFARGGYVTVTPNDMFLTRNGLVAASSLVQGDDVVYCGVSEWVSPRHPNNNQRPAPINNIFTSLFEDTSRSVKSKVGVASIHFHGDGAFGNGQVDIVRSNSFLRDARDFCSSEHIDKQFFKWPLTGQSCLSGQGGYAFASKRDRDSSCGVVGCHRHRHPFFGGSAFVNKELDFAETSFANSHFSKPRLDYAFANPEFLCDIVDCLPAIVKFNSQFDVNLGAFGPAFSESNGNTGFVDMIGDSTSGKSYQLADLLKAFTGEVSFDQIVSINCFHYQGPVYDIQTPSGLYIVGNGVVKSNCLALDGKEVPLDEPFTVLTAGNPAHRIIQHPPLHPHCFCSMRDVLGRPTQKPATISVPPSGLPSVKPPPILATNFTAGQHEPLPWDETILRQRSENLQLKNDADAKQKAKAVITSVTELDEELEVIEKTHEQMYEKIDTLQEQVAKLPANSTKAAKLREQITAISNDYYSTESIAARWAARRKAEEGKGAVVKKELAHPNPVKVVADKSMRIPAVLNTKIDEVCALLGNIMGKSDHGEGAIQIYFSLIPDYDTQREYHNSGSVYLTPQSSKTTILHEIGHAIAYLYPKAGAAVRAFHHLRCKGSPIVPMSKFGQQYDLGERGNEDNFGRVLGKGTAQAAYAGKVYQDGQTEILSMGLQLLLQDPKKFAKMDFEWFSLIVQILRGDLR